MADHHFDNLSRFLASGVSRRRMLQAVAATALSGLFVGSAGAAAAAPARGLGETCGTSLQCASGFCDTTQRPGQCSCPPGTTPCGGAHGGPITCVPPCPEGQYRHPYTCQCYTPAPG